MIKLSDRLFTIASFIRDKAKVVDVGCDHALLDIYLRDRYPEIKIIAVDNKKGAIDKAKLNLAYHKMTDIIDLRLSDGLDKVLKDEIDTVVIAGMGTSNIIEILNKDFDKMDKVDDLIIQANNDHYCLRKTICSMGFYIADEKLVKENDIYYTIIHFKRGYKKYRHKDHLCGPVLRSNKEAIYKELLNIELEKKEILLSQIPQKYFLKRQKLKNDILTLKSELK